MKKFSISLFVLLLLSTFSYAQNLSLSGTVLATNSPITAGAVRVYRVGNTNTPMQVATTQPVISGAFTAQIPSVGTYIVVAVADTNSYPNHMPTFYGDTIVWQEAIELNYTAQDTTFNITINLKELPNWTMGTGYCSGKVTYETFQRNSAVAGDPIPGIGISLEQQPGGIIKANDATDSSGFFEVTNIPMDTEYALIATVPGLDMNDTYQITINPLTDTVINLNFGVDTTHGAGIIFPINNTTFINSIKNDASLAVYPNPVSETLTINTESASSIQIMSVNGIVIMEINTKLTNNIIDVSKLSRGVYFVKTNDQTIKFIKL